MGDLIFGIHLGGIRRVLGQEEIPPTTLDNGIPLV